MLPYGRQQIDDDDVAAVTAVLRGDMLTTGPAVDRFEGMLCEVTGAQHAVACSSGTAALHLAMLASAIGPGDVVLVPSITFVASANAVRYVGAEVRFVDVDPESGLSSAEHFEAALDNLAEGSPAALMPVHLAGQCADPMAIRDLADKRGLRVVEDACHALGTVYGQGNARCSTGGCGHSDMAVFSFHPVKQIAMGEGGAITTNDAKLAESLRRNRSHGITRIDSEFENASLARDRSGAVNPWYYEQLELGLNYRASDIHCALGCSQLSKLARFVAERRRLAELYDSLLANLGPLVQPIRRLPSCAPSWHLYPVLIDFAAIGRSRSVVMQALRDAGIGTQVHYIPVHLQPYYARRYGSQSLPGAERFYERALSLPLYVGLGDDDVAHVVASLKAIVEH